MAGLQVTVTPDPSTSPFQQGAAWDVWQDGSRTSAGATQLRLLPFPHEQLQLCCRQEKRDLHTSGCASLAALLRRWPGMAGQEGTGWDLGTGQALQAHLALSKAAPFATTTARTLLQPAVSKNN